MRVRIVVVGVLSAVLSASGISLAGGGNWIEWSEDLVIGRPVVATADLYFPSAADVDAAVASGGFHLYLWPGEGWRGAGEALPRASLRVARMEILFRRGTVLGTRAEFVMPRLEAGVYTAIVCSHPCESLPGYVDATWTRVYESLEDARLEHRASRLEDRIYGLRQRTNRLARELKDVRPRVSIMSDRQRDSRAELERRIEALEAAQRERTQSQGWFVAGALLTLTVSGVAYRTGRTRNRDESTSAPDDPPIIEIRAE